jgi:GT2 family glycosyltransferase
LPIALCTQPGGGPAKARNRGADSARGRFLAFTDDDCRPDPDWIGELASFLERSPGTIVGGRTVNALNDNLFATASQGLIAYLYEYFNANPAKSWFLTSNNMALASERFRSVGGFNPLFPTAAAEDRDLCDRLRACGTPMVYAREAVIYHLHALTFRTFLRQHFGYGCGAFRYRYTHSTRKGEKIRMEPLRFYSGILSWPFRQAGIHHPIAVSTLLLLSQIANASGFFWQLIRSRCSGSVAGNTGTCP